jgi:soluble lytic murein transglycosylase-like protein
VKRKTFLWLLAFNALGAGFAYSPGVDAARALLPGKIFHDTITVTALQVDCTAERSKYAKMVQSISRKYDVDWRLVAAVATTESDFNPCAISPKGAIGLMQLLPETAEMYSIESKDLYDPEKNIRAGVQHLKMLSQLYKGNVQLTVAAYNAGQGAVEKYGGVPPYPETQAYVKKVMDIQTGLKTGSASTYSISMR